MQTTTPMTIARIDHVLLLVNGMERALSFYQNVLGCRLEHRMRQYGMAEVSAGDSQIDLVDIEVPEGEWAAPGVDGGRNMDHVCLRVQGDETAIREHLRSNGVAIVEERIEEQHGRREISLYVRDPARNTIELLLS